jgi:hypothetical protein
MDSPELSKEVMGSRQDVPFLALIDIYVLYSNVRGSNFPRKDCTPSSGQLLDVESVDLINI